MAEQRGWWERPVPVFVSTSGRLNVNNSMQAADVLLNRWPAKPGPKHVAARKAVLKAMENYRDGKALAKAREAFAEAAREAEIIIDED